MFSKRFMESYVSFLNMSMTIAGVGLVYYFLTKYLAPLVAEDYRQTAAMALGVVAVGIAYQMMEVIEEDKDQIIEDAEKMANRFYKSELD